MAGETLRVERLPSNERGRDLMVGDLHGCRAELDRALGELRFDPSADRVISVGDLVDRGPDSIGCLRLLRESWFHAVLGNHEDMMLDAARDIRRGGTLTEAARLHHHNEGEWLRQSFDLEDEELEELLKLAAQTPYVIVVGEGERRYHVVHAEFPALVTDADIDTGIPARLAGSLTWGRTIFRGEIDTTPRPGLSITYCGHTVGSNKSGQPLRSQSHVCLDTGCVLGRRLTIAVRYADGREEIYQHDTSGLEQQRRERGEEL